MSLFARCYTKSYRKYKWFEMAGRQLFSESEKICLQELLQKYGLHLTTTMSGNPAAKKMAWARLTEEFNSVEFNTKRTEPQLKKCWDNMKTRRKNVLAQEKRERMRTGGGPYPFPSSSQSVPPSAVIEDALMESTDTELQFVIDSDTCQVLSSGTDVEFSPDAPEAPQTDRSQESLPIAEEGVHTPAQQSITSQIGGKNIRTQVISQEFQLRADNYKRNQAREEELHRLKLDEMEWQVKTAKELYLKVKIERENAEKVAELLHQKARLEKEATEELCRYNRLKREQAEITNK